MKDLIAQQKFLNEKFIKEEDHQVLTAGKGITINSTTNQVGLITEGVDQDSILQWNGNILIFF